MGRAASDRPGRHSGCARAALERRTIHIPDVLADPDYTYGAKDVEAIRTVLGVPILKGDDLLGVIMIYHLEIRPFTDKQIALVTFADQAAIAIENVRLFDEVQARTENSQNRWSSRPRHRKCWARLAIHSRNYLPYSRKFSKMRSASAARNSAH